MCRCQNIEVGSYDNQVCITDLPPHMADYKVLQGGARSICIDACLEHEVKQLWCMGITTTGCCCGHNRGIEYPYIGVVSYDIERMKAMGYKVQLNPLRPVDEDSFIPKTV